MGLIRRGRIWHYEFQHKGQRFRGSTGQTNKAKAAAIEKRERDRAALGGNTEKTTLTDAAASWWEYRGQHRKDAYELGLSVEVCRRLINFNMLAVDLRSLHIAKAIAKRRGETTFYGKPPSNATVNREIINVMRPILRHASKIMDVRGLADIDWGDLTLTKPKPKPRELSDTEAAAIRGELEHWHRGLYDFYRRYGCRWQEAFFTLDKIDIDGRRIALRKRKGGDWHEIFITDEDAAEIASRMSRARAAGLDTVWFREMPDGTLVAIKPRQFQDASRRAIRRAGVKDVRSVHDYRHDAAMKAMRRSKGNLRAVQKGLGHESMVTTTIYAHAVEDDVREAFGGEVPTISPQEKRNVQ